MLQIHHREGHRYRYSSQSHSLSILHSGHHLYYTVSLQLVFLGMCQKPAQALKSKTSGSNVLHAEMEFQRFQRSPPPHLALPTARLPPWPRLLPRLQFLLLPPLLPSPLLPSLLLPTPLFPSPLATMSGAHHGQGMAGRSSRLKAVGFVFHTSSAAWTPIAANTVQLARWTVPSKTGPSV